MSVSFVVAFLLSPLLSDEFRDVCAVHWRAEGRQEAERDIAAGQMKYKIYGYMAGLSQRDVAFTRLMRERYDVSVVAVAQCCVTHELVKSAEGYNDRIEEELNAKFDPGAVKRTWSDSGSWYQLPLGRWGLRIPLFLSAGMLLWRLSRRLRGEQAHAPT